MDFRLCTGSRAARRSARDGWEYSWEYPKLDEQPRPRQGPGLPAGNAGRGTTSASDPQDFYAVIPEHQPGNIFKKILSALDPGRWAKAFAGWVIEGTHGTLCGVVERASGDNADNCGGGTRR